MEILDYLNQNGETILEPKYKHIGSEYNAFASRNGLISCILPKRKQFGRIEDFTCYQMLKSSNYLPYKPQVIFTTSQKTGVADLNGKVLIPAVYDEITYAHGNWITGVLSGKTE
jgi:hypothetical protein